MSANQLNVISQDKFKGEFQNQKQNGQMSSSSSSNQLQLREGQNQMLLSENINSNFQSNKNNQQQLTGQSTGQQIQRFNNAAPNIGSNNSLSNQNNQNYQNQDSQSNSQNLNQQQGTINGNNYKVIKTYQKVGVAGSSATNFSSQNTTQSSRKRGSQNQHQSQSQSQQQMVVAAQQEIALIREQCIFCQKFTAYHSFGPLLNKALYSKYSSSQNYFYSKDINDILGNASTKVVIRFRDLETFDEEEEFLKRFYHKNQQPAKMRDLTEYYKYHKDIPRLFMVSIGNVMNRYHDKRRRIEYQRIKKQLNFETSNNNNTEDSQLNTEEEDSNGNKAQKKKEIPKECSNMLQELDVTLSFHQRMESKTKLQKIDGLPSNQHISAQYNGMNAFYMNQQPNKVYLQQQNRNQTNQFDMSSMMQKASNKNFFPAQAASGSTNSKSGLQNQIQYNYYKAGDQGNANESSYQLSRILQSFQQNPDDKYFYSIETSISNLNNILYTQTDDLSFISSQNIQLIQQPQSSRVQLTQNSNSNKIVPILNFSKNNKNTLNSIQTPKDDPQFQAYQSSQNKQKLENALLNQKYQNILSQNQMKQQQQQSSSSGSSNNYTSNSQQILNPFQEIHANLPSTKLSNIIQEQQIKMQKALLNNGMQLSSNNIDSTQKQSINQIPSQPKIQQNISSSQSSSNSLVKQNNLNSQFVKQTSTGSSNNIGAKESGMSIDKIVSQQFSTTNQQKQIISAKQIMKVLTQNQNTSSNKNTTINNNNQAGTATNSPQTSLIEKESKQPVQYQSQQQPQSIDQLKVNNQANNNTGNQQGLTRNKSNQSISQKILQKRASDNIYSSASINPLLQCSTRIPSTQKNSQIINAINQLPFQMSNQNSNNSTNNSNNNMKKFEIDASKQQQIERRYQTADRERIFSERKELNDKFSITNTINQLKQSEKQSPTLKLQQQNLLPQQQQSQNQILQIMSQRQSKEQIYTQKQQQFEQYQLKQHNTPANAANTSRPRSSLHQNSASQQVNSNSKQNSNKNQQAQINPLFQTLRQQNSQHTFSNTSSNFNNQMNNPKCESMPSSTGLNSQTNQNQQQSQLSSTLQFLTSQNSQNNLQFSQLQGISDGSSSPQQLFYQNQQHQLILNDLQSHYHYSSPNTNNNIDKIQYSSNNNGDLRIKKRKEGQTSLNVKGNSITGISQLVGSSSNMNFSQLSQINQPNISQLQNQQQQQQQQQQSQQSARNHLKSQNSSQKKIKHSQHQAPQLDLQHQINIQMNSNHNLIGPSSTQQAAQISQTNFFNQKRNSQVQQLNPELIKTQVYKTQSTLGNNPNQKNRSSSNPKQLKFPLNTNNYNTNFSNTANVQIPKNQNFILQYDTNTPNSINQLSNIQPTPLQLQHQQQQLANYQQQQQQIIQQQQQQQQAQQGKHQKSNSIAGLQNNNNNIYKQSSVSHHTNFNSNHSQTSSQPNLLSPTLLNQMPQNMNVLSALNTQPTSAKTANNNIANNQQNSGNSSNTLNNFTQINLQLIKNYNSGNNNIVNQNIQNSSDATNTLTIGTPVYQQNNQGMQKHSRTRSQELITNQMNIIGSSTARCNNDIANPNAQQIGIVNNLQGGVSQINQVYEQKYHYNQPQSVRNKAERTASTHFSDSIKRLIEQNTISSSSTTTNRTGSMISAQQFISSKQKSQIQSNQNLTNNSSKYYNQNLTNSPVSIRKSIMNTNNNNANAANANNNANNQKKMNRIDSFAARVSNMINIFDPNQQNSQQVLTNLHNSNGAVNNINSNLSNYNTNQISQAQQPNNNFNQNMNVISNNNSGTNNSNYATQSNQANTLNYPPSARINLNAKNSQVNSHTGSLSRNNSPSKQKPIGEINIIQNQIAGSISPQLINSGSTGQLQLNYQVPQNFLPSSTQSNTAQNQYQQTNNSSRNTSTQRGTTKASQLIRYRQNNQ